MGLPMKIHAMYVHLVNNNIFIISGYRIPKFTETLRNMRCSSNTLILERLHPNINSKYQTHAYILSTPNHTSHFIVKGLIVQLTTSTNNITTAKVIPLDMYLD